MAEPFECFYKYVTVEGVLDILSNMRLKFTRVTDLNDRFDMYHAFEFDFTEEDFASAYIQEYKNMIYSDEILKFVSIDDPSTNIDTSEIRNNVMRYREFRNILSTNLFENKRREIIQIHRDILETGKNNWKKQRNHTYVLSVTEIHDNFDMWERYAVSHTGAVIGIKCTPEHNHLFQAEKVEYNDEIPFVSSLVDWVKFCLKLIELDWNKHIYRCIHRKQLNWANEQEWRCVYYIPDSPSQPFIYLPISSKEIECVYLGHSMDECNRQNVIDIATDLNINVFQAKRESNSQ